MNWTGISFIVYASMAWETYGPGEGVVAETSGERPEISTIPGTAWLVLDSARTNAPLMQNQVSGMTLICWSWGR